MAVPSYALFLAVGTLLALAFRDLFLKPSIRSQQMKQRARKQLSIRFHNRAIELFLKKTAQHDSFSERGNVVAIQPYMLPEDYADEWAFFDKLNGYFKGASERGMFHKKTIVVLPEHIGTWLFAANEFFFVFRNLSTTMLFLAITLRSPLACLLALVRIVRCQGFSTPGLWRKVVMTAKARTSASIYMNTMQRLAVEWGVCIVGGSIALPNPEVKFGLLETVIGDRLHNVSVFFHKPGYADSKVVCKRALTALERQYIDPKLDGESTQVYETQLGTVAVLIGEDSWQNEAYAPLVSRVDFIACPSSVALPFGQWSEESFSENVTVRQQWLSAGLPAKLAQISLPRPRKSLSEAENNGDCRAVYVFFRGVVWGHTEKHTRSSRTTTPPPPPRTSNPAEATACARPPCWGHGADGHVISVCSRLAGSPSPSLAPCGEETNTGFQVLSTHGHDIEVCVREAPYLADGASIVNLHMPLPLL